MIHHLQTLNASAGLELENIVMYVFSSYHIVNRLCYTEKTCKDTDYLHNSACKDDILEQYMQPF
jgi:hypothetical protein